MSDSPDALIIFGDGGQALWYGEKNITTNREGVRVRPILVVPEGGMRERYDLEEVDLNIVTEDNRRGIWMDYPVKHMKWLTESKSGGVLLVFCAFDGSRTNLMYHYQELLDFIKLKDKTELRLRAEVSALHAELEMVTTNMPEYLRKQKEMKDIVAGKEETYNEED